MAFTRRTRSGYDQERHNHARTAQTLPSALQAYPFFTMSIKPPDFGLAEPLSLRKFGLCGSAAVAVWWSQTGSNRRPPACKAGALPTELWPRVDLATLAVATLPGVDLRGELEAPATKGMVGLERFELSTSRLSSARSNQLSYRPGKRGRCPNEERETKAAVSRMHSKNRSDS